MLKVRIHLLSDRALRYLLNKASSSAAVKDCFLTLSKVLKSENNFKESKSSSYRKHRCCKSSKFNFLTCGGFERVTEKDVKSVFQIDGGSLRCMKRSAPLKRMRHFSDAVCIEDKVYIFAGYMNTFMVKVIVTRLSLKSGTK